MAILSVANLRFGYGDHIVLDGANMTLEHGEHVGMVGRGEQLRDARKVARIHDAAKRVTLLRILAVELRHGAL